MGRPVRRQKRADAETGGRGQDFVIACVGNDNDLREVMLGDDGVFAGVTKGAIVVDHTTRPRRSPASFMPKQKNAALIFRCAGFRRPGRRRERRAHGDVRRRRGAVREAEKVIAAYARACNLLGASGSGQLAKMVNQICIAGLVQGLAEGLHFAMKAGLDIEKLIATISKGAAQSWQMENRYKTMVAGKFDFGFAVDWMRKDLTSVSMKRGGMERICRPRRSSTNSTRRCKRWAASAGIRRV